MDLILFYVFVLFNFPGSGGGIFGGSLQSAAALLVDTYQRGRRGCALNFVLHFRR